VTRRPRCCWRAWRHGEPLVQGLGHLGLVRRRRVEVVLLAPLVTVVTVLTSHLAVASSMR
jgi:hypothetical protein